MRMSEWKEWICKEVGVSQHATWVTPLKASGKPTMRQSSGSMKWTQGTFLDGYQAGALSSCQANPSSPLDPNMNYFLNGKPRGCPIAKSRVEGSAHFLAS